MKFIIVLCLIHVCIFSMPAHSNAEPQEGKNASCDRLLKEAESWTRSGKFQQSISLFDRMIEDKTCSDDLKCDAYFGRGLAKDRFEDLNGAITDYGKALQGRPGSTKFRETLGNAFFRRAGLRERLGDIRGAMRDYEKALEHVPDLQDARGYLSMIYYNIGLKDETGGDLIGAERNYKKALKINPGLKEASGGLNSVEDKKHYRSQQKDSLITF